MFEYTKNKRTVFIVAVLAIMIMGFIGGIGAGMSLRGPSAETLENFQEASNNASRYTYLYRDELVQATEQLAAEQYRWGAESTIAMLAVWVVSAILAIFGYGILLILEMLDEIMWSDSNTGTTVPESEYTGYSLSELANETTSNSSSWICRECGTKNSTGDVCCKDCGKYK